MSDIIPPIDLYETGDGDEDSIVPALVGFALAATALGAIGYGVKMYVDERATTSAKEGAKASMRPRTAEQVQADTRDFVREWQAWLRTPEGDRWAQKDAENRRIASYYRSYDVLRNDSPKVAEPAGAVRPQLPYVDPTPTQIDPMRRSSALTARPYVIPQQVPPYREALVEAGVGKRTIVVGKTPAERVAFDDWNRRQQQRNSPGELARFFETQRAKKGKQL